MSRVPRNAKNEPTREELTKQVGQLLAQSDSRPDPFFGSLALAEGQTAEVALAEWHALIVAVTTYAIWASLDSKEKIFPILDEFHAAFVNSLQLGCREEFLRIASSREEDYIGGISAALQGDNTAKALHLASLILGRITGHCTEEIEGKELSTLPGSPDIISSAALWKLIVDRIVATKDFFDKLQRGVPRIFL